MGVGCTNSVRRGRLRGAEEGSSVASPAPWVPETRSVVANHVSRQIAITPNLERTSPEEGCDHPFVRSPNVAFDRESKGWRRCPSEGQRCPRARSPVAAGRPGREPRERCASAPSSQFVPTWWQPPPASGGAELATSERVSSERICEILASLVRDQAKLGRNGAERAALEANGLAIAYWRSRLLGSLTDEPATSDQPTELV